MSAIDFPAVLTTANWDKQKAALGTDKAVAAKLHPAKLGEALKTLGKSHAAFDDAVLDGRGAATAAEAEEALERLDAAVKSELKKLRSDAASAAAAADEFGAAAEKLRKTVPGPSATVAAGAMGAAALVSKAASAFDRELDKRADAARAELVAALAKLKSQEKKGSPAPVVDLKNSKAGKFIRSKALECIRKVKKPAPGARPWRFIVVRGTPSVTVCLLQAVPGGTHEKMLKSLIPNEKTQTLKDPKGEVIWEKNALTLVSDRLPAGLAKRMQEWLRKLTKLNAKIRIRKTTGEAEESEDGEDISDAMVKADPAEAAAKAQAGKDYLKRLAGLTAAIRKAMTGSLPADIKAEIKETIDAITKHGKAQEYAEADEGLDALEALLEDDEASADAASSAPAAVPAAAQAPGNKQLASARLDWGRQRTHAVAEITRLAGTVVQHFRNEPEQAAQVKKAVQQFQSLATMLKSDLEDQLDATLGESDPAKRARLAATAKQTLRQVQALIDKDPLMRELDGNELIADMKVVEPMRKSLTALETALG